MSPVTLIPTPPEPRDPIIVLILNLCAGCGYFYLGQKKKGVAAVLLWIIVGIPTCGSGAGLLSIVYAVDGLFQARLAKSGLPIGEWSFFNRHY